MREINSKELKQINGGGLPVVAAIVTVYAVSYAAAYAVEKYRQHRYGK
jgi:lactobin A/cerein 7B family class IIb bacteriocin